MTSCRHEGAYHGVINLFDGRWLVGAVDVWRCVKCGTLSVDEKRYGVLEPPPELGFREPAEGARWVLFVCSKPEGIHWVLTDVKPGKTIPHPCVDGKEARTTVLDDFTVEVPSGSKGEARHRLLLVEECLNKGFDVSIQPQQVR